MFGFFNKKKKRNNLDEAINILCKIYKEIGIKHDIALKMSVMNLTIADSFAHNNVFSPLVLVINGMAFHRGHFISQVTSGETENETAAKDMISFYDKKIFELIGIARKMNLSDSELVSIMEVHGSLSRSDEPLSSNQITHDEKITYASYEEWLIAYKKAAASVNPQLELSEDGSSLIDFMDDEPTQRAFKDNVDPEYLGKEFGKQFDLTTFG